MTDQQTNTQTPEAETPKAGNGLALLALLIGAAGATLGYISHQKNEAQEAVISKLLQELNTAQQQQAQLTTQLQQTQSALLSASDVSGLAQKEIEKLQLNEQFSVAMNAAIATLPVPVTQDDVVQLLNQASEQFQNTEKRINEQAQLELGKIQQQHAQSQALLLDANELTSKVTLVYREKAQAIEALTQEKLDAIARAQSTLAYSAPVENALKLALSSAKQGQFQASHALLQEAIASFDVFNLNEKPYAELKERLVALLPQFQALSEQQSSDANFEALLATLPEWTFKAPDAENQLKAKDVASEQAWDDKLLAIGNNVLAKTVTITKSSDEAISWVNSSANLRAIIRQNVQLDLAFARNALQVGDVTEFERVRGRLIEYISRYFDNNDANVAKALEVLTQLQHQTADLQGLLDVLQTLEALKAQ